jgi:hypothetical protein
VAKTARFNYSSHNEFKVPSWWDMSSIWQIAPILPLIASVIIYYKSRKIKSLSYEIVADELLLTVNEELQGKIKVFYDNNPIEDISLLVIKFLNNGNESIKSDDFEEPITISFSSNVGIFSVELKQAEPPTIKAKLKIENDKIIIEPMLLNKGDFIIIKVLLTGSKTGCEIPSHTNLGAYRNAHLFKAKDDLMLQTRIIGITAIKEITDKLSIKIFKNFEIIIANKPSYTDILIMIFSLSFALILWVFFKA